MAINYDDHEPVESHEEFEAKKRRILGFIRSLTESERRVLGLVLATPIWLSKQGLADLPHDRWLFRFNELVRTTSNLDYPGYMACINSILVKATKYLDFPTNLSQSEIRDIPPTAVGVFKFLSCPYDFVRLYEATMNIMEGNDSGLVRDMRTKAERAEQEAQQSESVIGEVLRRIKEGST